ncbi:MULTISPECIES: hypothetical protein [Sphingobacterium]|uniref:hypothetical protein n=1 Tax=Sphingobacterium TaxID=28453 RepID=UPI001049C1C2|nr:MULTISPECIES: hypothetical protein [Sphingobacterium]MCW2258686.1 hypothetical protein [Sphingobacterium kitahiroshimense]TCR14858.1 hypothetical protein EDF67_101965 [Sphingobacterium sp. JUb78]
MTKENYNPDKEFADRIVEALTFYHLEEADLGKLINTNATDVRKIISLQTTLGLKRANKISSVFGMKYHQFGNPRTKLHPKEKLPASTIAIIDARSENGPSSNIIDTELDLPLHTMKILRDLKITDEFTPTDIHEKLPDEVKSKAEANRITVLFKTGSLRNYVIYTNRKQGTKHIYKFVSEESKKIMEELLIKLEKKKKELNKDQII